MVSPAPRMRRAAVESVHAGHLDVEDDQVGPVRGGLVEGVGPVHGDLRVVALEGEAALECFAHRRLVVDDQDALGVTVAFGGAHGFGFLGCGGTAGS